MVFKLHAAKESKYVMSVLYVSANSYHSTTS